MKLWTQGSQVGVSILTKLGNTINNSGAGKMGTSFNDERYKDTYFDLRDFIETFDKKTRRAIYGEKTYNLSKNSPNSIYNFKTKKNLMTSSIKETNDNIQNEFKNELKKEDSSQNATSRREKFINDIKVKETKNIESQKNQNKIQTKYRGLFSEEVKDRILGRSL